MHVHMEEFQWLFAKQNRLITKPFLCHELWQRTRQMQWKNPWTSEPNWSCIRALFCSSPNTILNASQHANTITNGRRILLGRRVLVGVVGCGVETENGVSEQHLALVRPYSPLICALVFPIPPLESKGILYLDELWLDWRTLTLFIYYYCIYFLWRILMKIVK